MKRLPVATMMTNAQMSFAPVKQYTEWHDYKRRTFERYNEIHYENENATNIDITNKELKR